MHPAKNFQHPAPDPAIIYGEGPSEPSSQHDPSNYLVRDGSTIHDSYKRSHTTLVHRHNRDYPGNSNFGPSHGKSPGSRQDLSLARQVRQLEFGQNKVGRDGHCRYGHCYGVDDQQKNICDSSSQFPLTGAHRQPQNCLRSSPLPYTLDQKEEHAARQVELETERSTSDHGYLGASPPTRVRHGLPDPNHRNREFDTEGYAPSGGLPNSINKQQSSWSPQYSGVENTDYSMSYGELPPQMTRQTGVPNPVAKGQMQACKCFDTKNETDDRSLKLTLFSEGTILDESFTSGESWLGQSFSNIPVK